MEKYIRLNNGEILFNSDIDVENNNISSNPLNLLHEGDLVKVEYYSPIYDERIAELFQVYIVSYDLSLTYLRNRNTILQIHNGEFLDKDYEPVIRSIITKEKIDSIEFNIDDEYKYNYSR